MTAAIFDTSGGRNFTAPHLGGRSPWTGVDSNATANVFSTVVELPTRELGASPDIRIWGRCPVVSPAWVGRPAPVRDRQSSGLCDVEPPSVGMIGETWA